MNLFNYYSKASFGILNTIDYLINIKVNSANISNYEEIINSIGKIVNDLDKQESGYHLFEIGYEKTRTLILLTKDGKSYFNIDTWNIKNNISELIYFKSHEFGNTWDIKTRYMENVRNNPKYQNSLSITYGIFLTACFTETLNGIAIIEKHGIDFIEYVHANSNFSPINISLTESYNDNKNVINNSSMDNIHKININKLLDMKENYKEPIKRSEYILNKFHQTLKCEALHINANYNASDNLIYGKILEVKTFGNIRFAKWIVYKLSPNNINYAYEFHSYDIEVQNINNFQYQLIDNNYYTLGMESNSSSYGYGYNRSSPFSRVHYNFIDKNREFIATSKGFRYKWTCSQDPAVDNDSSIKFWNSINDNIINENMNPDLSETYIQYNDDTRQNIRFNSLNSLRENMQTIKNYVNEYNYITKKKSAFKGDNVFITDNIQYLADTGCIKYNDFSLAINDDLIKNDINNNFNNYILQFYRKELTEEIIIENILTHFYTSLTRWINRYASSESNVIITINENINLKIDMKLGKNKSKLFYLNGQRFNKDEIILILKELVCSKNQKDADNFIKNIGKLGLSVYIGIVSGYCIQTNSSTKLFKFTKEKGRSKYSMHLNEVKIPIKGKAIFNKLFDITYLNTVDDHSNAYKNSKFNELIYKSCESLADYIKYKFLIDSAYEEFKSKSLEFLNKKIDDVNGEQVFMKHENGKIMNGVKIIGTSKNTYVIAYNLTESFVYSSPTLTNDKKIVDEKSYDIYSGGKYICMIDQSKIKSAIGYDTVISKMMALKNDSYIAGQIYNLAEELNISDDDNDVNEENNDE